MRELYFVGEKSGTNINVTFPCADILKERLVVETHHLFSTQ